MKKCTFYRTIYNPGGRGTKAVKTEGFCETLTDKNGNEITLCFHKTPTIPYSATQKNVVWTVTEKSTGLRVCESNKRMEALEEAKKYLDKIYEKIQQAEKYKGIIARAYAEG